MRVSRAFLSLLWLFQTLAPVRVWADSVSPSVPVQLAAMPASIVGLPSWTANVSSIQREPVSSEPPFNLNQTRLSNGDILRLSDNKYRFQSDGTILPPEGGEPIARSQMQGILEELAGRQKLKALLQLDLIFNQYGYKHLPDQALTNVRRISRQNWAVLPKDIRADLSQYFTPQELEGLKQTAAPVKSNQWNTDLPPLAPLPAKPALPIATFIAASPTAPAAGAIPSPASSARAPGPAAPNASTAPAPNIIQSQYLITQPSNATAQTASISQTLVSATQPATVPAAVPSTTPPASAPATPPSAIAAAAPSAAATAASSLPTLAVPAASATPVAPVAAASVAQTPPATFPAQTSSSGSSPQAAGPVSSQPAPRLLAALPSEFEALPPPQILQASSSNPVPAASAPPAVVPTAPSIAPAPIAAATPPPPLAAAASSGAAPTPSSSPIPTPAAPESAAGPAAPTPPAPNIISSPSPAAAASNASISPASAAPQNIPANPSPAPAATPAVPSAPTPGAQATSPSPVAAAAPALPGSNITSSPSPAAASSAPNSPTAPAPATVVAAVPAPAAIAAPAAFAVAPTPSAARAEVSPAVAAALAVIANAKKNPDTVSLGGVSNLAAAPSSVAAAAVAAPTVAFHSSQTMLPPEPPPPSVPDYPETPKAAFDVFLKDAPYGHDVADLLKLISDHASEDVRHIVLGALIRYLPQVVIDPVRAGSMLRADTRKLNDDLYKAASTLIVLNRGPVIVREHSFLLFGPKDYMLPIAQDYYNGRAVTPPPLQAASSQAYSTDPVTTDWGDGAEYPDGSRRLIFSKEELAATLVYELVKFDARLRAWDRDAYGCELRARSAEFRFLYQLQKDTGKEPKIGLDLRVEYAEWLSSPDDWEDSVLQALASPKVDEVLTAMSGNLEQRAAWSKRHDLKVLEEAGLTLSDSAQKALAQPAPPTPDLGETNAGLQLELRRLAQDSTIHALWLQEEETFRRNLK